MRIFMLAAAGSVHTMRWAGAFAAQGHAVHLASQHAPGPNLDPRVTVHRLPHMRGAGYLLNRSRIAGLLSELSPDVVNAHYATGYGTLARGVKNVPLVMNVWGSDVYEFPDRSPLHRRWLVANLRNADKIVSTSESMATRTRSLATDLPPITVVPFGVDTEVFHPRSNGDRSGPVVIGTVRSLAEVYGMDTFIKAIALLKKAKTGRDIKARIVGGGPLDNKLKELAASLGIADRIEFKGAVPHAQVAEEFRSMDIHVALSRAESFGVAVIEASSCGLPAIASNVGGLPEVVCDGVTGLLVPPNEPQAAADAILQLLNTPGMMQRMGEAGRNYVKEHFEWKDCVVRMHDVLKETAEQGRK